MKKLLYAAAALLYFSACAPDKFETIKVGNLYSLDVPSYMTKTNKLHEAASLQYYDSSKKFYVMVLAENIDTLEQTFAANNVAGEYTNGLKGYVKLLMDNTTSKMDSYTATPFKEEKINGLDAITFDMDAVMNGTKLYFKRAFIKGKSNYYQLSPWISSANKDAYENVMYKIIHSFKEL